jgi:hypothetical protein
MPKVVVVVVDAVGLFLADWIGNVNKSGDGWIVVCVIETSCGDLLRSADEPFTLCPLFSFSISLRSLDVLQRRSGF